VKHAFPLLFAALMLASCGDDDSRPDSGSGLDSGFDGGAEDAGTDTGPPDAGPCPEGCFEGDMCCQTGLNWECIPIGDSGTCPMADLTVSEETLRTSVFYAWDYFAPESCAIAEGCITTPGWRRLLRFSTQTPNIGDADIHLGRPTDANPHFTYSECHDHYHFNGYADYKLLASDGSTVGTGHKQAFCLLDSERFIDEPWVPRGGRYTCENQGIQRGWSDIYDSSLDCQWIDVTDVTPGEYMLQVAINHEHVLPEASYDNNTVAVAVTVPVDMPQDPLADCTVPAVGPTRDCGWSLDPMSHTCTAGSMVRIGCGAGCGLGSCSGDPVMRICESGACSGRDSLGFDDDSCGSYCPVLTFTCPESGMYSVMTGSWEPGTIYGCTPGVM